MSTHWAKTLALFLVFAFLSVNPYDLDHQFTVKFSYKIDIKVLIM